MSLTSDLVGLFLWCFKLCKVSFHPSVNVSAGVFVVTCWEAQESARLSQPDVATLVATLSHVTASDLQTLVDSLTLWCLLSSRCIPAEDGSWLGFYRWLFSALQLAAAQRRPLYTWRLSPAALAPPPLHWCWWFNKPFRSCCMWTLCKHWTGT